MDPSPSAKLLARQLLDASNGSLEQATSVLRNVNAEKIKRVKIPPKGELILSAKNLVKSYKVGRNTVKALNDASVDIYAGEFVAITGSSGSGKSTLLQLLGGLDKPDGGTVTVQGSDIAKFKDGTLSAFRNKTIGFVFQFFYLQPFLNLQTNIEVPAMFAKTDRTDRQARSRELSGMVGLSDRIKHLPRELSGGQMQRAAIARALQNNPPILLADEPTGNLDRTNALAIFEIFRQIRDEQGTTVIVVTHDLELAEMADRRIDMSDGVVVL